MCPVITISNQDGRQAKNGKKGDAIKKKSSPLKLRAILIEGSNRRTSFWKRTIQ
jgi:hypothetical protein